eukprot:7807415-Pyramimonas_sp.AAC.1
MRPASSRKASDTLPPSMNRRSPAYKVDELVRLPEVNERRRCVLTACMRRFRPRRLPPGGLLGRAPAAAPERAGDAW